MQWKTINNFPLYKIPNCINMKRNNTSIVTGTTMPKPTTNNTNNNPNNTLDTGDPNKKLAGINMLINLTIWNEPILQYTNPRPIRHQSTLEPSTAVQYTLFGVNEKLFNLLQNHRPSYTLFSNIVCVVEYCLV